jgi:hypothetical protein
LEIQFCFLFYVLSSRWRFLISAAFPQDMAPSEQPPFTQAGPAYLKSRGLTLRTCSSINQAISQISHCARLQQRSLKKL